MRNTRSLTLIATLLVVVTLFILGCKPVPHSTAESVAVDESVIADVLGDCDGTASSDELGQLESFFSQHSTGWFVGVFPLTWEDRDSDEVSADGVRNLFGRYRLYGPYESENELRNDHQVVAMAVNTPYLGIYVIEKDVSYSITHLYRAVGDHVYDGAWKEIAIASNGTSYEALSVSLGEEFVLHEKQCAAIEGVDLVVEVVAFYNSPCPDGMECVWSGVGIQFRYRHAGEVQAGTTLVQAFGYQTTILDTDHETFVRLTITRM
jgi:hypothetical protein